MIACLLLAALSGPFDDWPRFRGPQGSGHGEVELPAPFSLAAPLWEVSLHGDGHSSPVVSDGTLVVTWVEETDRPRRSIAAYHVKDGEPRWQRTLPFERHGQHTLNSFASSTPAVGGGRAFVLWTSGGRLEARAYTLDEGEPLWQRDLGPFQAQHGSAVSPVLVGEVLLVGNEHEGEESFLAGLDAKTGEDVWRIARVSSERRGSYATPVVYDGPGGKPVAIFSSTGHGLTGVDPAQGKIVWNYDPGFDQRCVGSPVVAGGVVFQAAGSGGGGKEYVALRLPTEQDAQPEVAWTTRLKGLPYVPTPIAVGEHLFLFGDGGIATCLVASSGVVRWQERLDGGVYASPILAGDTLIVITTDGVLHRLRAATTFEVLGTTPLGERCQATPAIADRKLLLRFGRRLVAIGATKQND
ncbi:MAG: PQQ-binding-like beta-propeller repeat protein [Planctomycetota bacterium]|nr:PQQ-binding-like beta-propeller repeat protein [Planctomycetota bacterium]